jgi:hypothetical protein
MRYQVRKWENDEVIKEFDNLRRASNCARLQGHTGEDIEIYTGYPPIAYVWDTELNGLVYNPRFGKQISSAVAGYINSIPGGSL